MRHALVSLFALVAIGCANAQRSTPSPPATLTIPSGPGEWVIVEREIPLETLSTGRLVLPYGAGSTGRALSRDEGGNDAKQVTRYQIVFAADPLAAGDRCALSMVSFQVVHADGSISETPVQGYVIDNSDRQEGFRAALSIADRKQLVIPAGATATTMFDKPVTISTR